ncbi:hypothetical protein V7S43_005570 [Phytophthora oleae]|uniref:Uncharacterized protein n=1 Tax=Phytophthora oleae TaxID=2107226 RepID=A0ABD3FRW6_9STRA
MATSSKRPICLWHLTWLNETPRTAASGAITSQIHAMASSHKLPVWGGWAFLYAVVLLTFSVYRCTALGALIKLYGGSEEDTLVVVTEALSIGFLQDFVCATYFATILWLFDTFVRPRCLTICGRLGSKVLLATVSWLLFVAMMAPFVADVVIVRLRDLRFTFELVTMAIEEKDHADSMAVSSDQVMDACLNVAALVIVATLFAVVRACPWADLSRWKPTQLLCNSQVPYTYSALSPRTEQNLKNLRQLFIQFTSQNQWKHCQDGQKAEKGPSTWYLQSTRTRRVT